MWQLGFSIGVREVLRVVGRNKDVLKIRYKDKDGNKIFNDPLEWWKLHAAKYPNLARLAKIYLAVQATSAASERVFSLASRLITAKRNRIDGDTAGSQFFVNRNLEWFESVASLEEALDKMLREDNEDPDEDGDEN